MIAQKRSGAALLFDNKSLDALAFYHTYNILFS